jgi:hypothetical protein
MAILLKYNNSADNLHKVRGNHGSNKSGLGHAEGSNPKEYAHYTMENLICQGFPAPSKKTSN